MSAAWATVLAGAFVAIASIVGVLATNRVTRKSTAQAKALEERVVNRADFDAVMGHMKGQLDRADKRITELETRLEAEVAARQAAEERAEKAEARAERAEARTHRLERRVKQLEQVLTKEGLTVPPPEPFDDEVPDL